MDRKGDALAGDVGPKGQAENEARPRHDEAEPPRLSPHAGMSFKEFVVCIALIQATVALAIDVMIPALAQIGSAMGLRVANERQWVITAFLLGFGGAQLLYGLAADRFGRRPVLLLALAVYVVCALAAATAPSFAWLLTARVLQGVGAAGAQVLSVSIVRDCYAGRRMAEVNSLSFMVFLAAPIFAPSLGQLVLLIAPWQAIFIGLALYASGITFWVALRMPETQNPANRLAISRHEIFEAWRLTLSNRTSFFYTLGITLMFGGWLGFINSAQQVFADVFHVPRLFPMIFAACSVCMAIAALTNAKLVERLGMRRIAHGAMLSFLGVAALQATAAVLGRDALLTFAVLQSAMMLCFGFLGTNCGAIAMEPLGKIAGTAASVQGFISTLGAACIGFFIGQQFNGSLVPLSLGFCLCSLGCLLAISLAEHGRLFRHQAALFSDSGARR